MNFCSLIFCTTLQCIIGPALAFVYPICGASLGVSCFRVPAFKWLWLLKEEKPEEPVIESITHNLIGALMLVMEPLTQFYRKIHQSCVKMVSSQADSISSNYYIIVLAIFATYMVIFFLMTWIIGYAYIRNLKNECKNRLQQVFKFKPKAKRS